MHHCSCKHILTFIIQLFQKYPLELEYRCFDGAVESFVKLTITMRKINLNPPFFLSEKYTVNDVTESSQTPDSLLQVEPNP